MLPRQQNILRLEAALIPMKPEMILNGSTFSTSIPLTLIQSIRKMAKWYLLADSRKMHDTSFVYKKETGTLA